MTERAVVRAAVLAAAVLAAGTVPPRGAPVAYPDTLGVWRPTSEGSAFDRVERADYLRAHAFSLDNFLEFAPGGVLVRTGPIGSVSAYSRWGIGRGRAAFSVDRIPFNDPESGVAPWVDIATSGLGSLDRDARAWSPGWIEGSVALTTAAPSLSRPSTYVELSKGTNDLRQRRVRFGSEEGRVGIDLSYDEVLDDGYGFDASGVVPDVPDYGKARSRNSALALRGTPDEGTQFTFGFRQFETSTSGDLSTTDAEGRRDGHLAWLDAAAGGVRLTVYGRGFSTADPDSESVNETAGVALETGLGGAAHTVNLRVSAEETSFAQDAGAGYSARLVGGRGVLAAQSRVADGLEVFAGASAEGDEESDLAWGAFAGLRGIAQRRILALQAGRTSRLPTLAERFLPAHDSGGRIIAGDNGVDPEHAFELCGDWEEHRGVLVNRVRASWITAERHIAFRPRAVGSETWRVASNADDAQSMFFAEERVRAEFALGPLRTLSEGALLFTSGDRAGAFASVPELQGNASVLIGGEMFEATSGLYAGAEYVHMGERADYDGRALPAYDVLNLTLLARLLDVQLYLRWINVLDERYTTYGDYLMTPDTFAYGIEWTLFN